MTIVLPAIAQVVETEAAERLRAILEGTNLFAMATPIQVLSRTEISPALAPEVLGA